MDLVSIQTSLTFVRCQFHPNRLFIRSIFPAHPEPEVCPCPSHLFINNNKIPLFPVDFARASFQFLLEKGSQEIFLTNEKEFCKFSLRTWSRRDS